MMRRESEQRPRVGIQPIPVSPEVFKSLRLKLFYYAPISRAMKAGERVQHPRLLIKVFFFIDQFLVEPLRAALDRIRLDFYS